MTPRPRSKDLKVRLQAAESALPSIIQWFGELYQEANRDEIINQLAEGFNHSTDGYKICRFLDQQYSWQPDTELTEILDTQYLWNAEHIAVAEWAKHTEIEPTFKVGDMVSFNWFDSTWTAGVIDDIYLGMATYSVKLEKHHQISYVAVPFEDAQQIRIQEDAESVI